MAISGFVQQSPLTTATELSRTSSDGMTKDEVERIHQLAWVANDYLREIGDYEDIHALFENPTTSEVQVSRLVEDIENKWQVPVDVQGDSANRGLSVDLFLFDIAIGNLVDNARKFGRDPDAVRISVQTTDGCVLFDVTDDGPGIPASETQKVFRQFYKIEERGTNAVKGCGLGLYVTRRIAKAHRGTCDVQSTTPSTLRLALPLFLHTEARHA